MAQIKRVFQVDGKPFFPWGARPRTRAATIAKKRKRPFAR